MRTGGRGSAPLRVAVHWSEVHALTWDNVKHSVRVLILIAAALPALAGEYAVLKSGQRMRMERHEISGGTIRLFQSGGVIELPVNAIEGFEQDDFRPPEPVAEKPVEAVAAPATSPPASREPKVLIREAALRSGLPPAFVESVARVESALRPDAISVKGAIGVMQLMPKTARDLGADPHNVEQNIDAGARLLRELLLKYDGDVVKALAAYNAGPQAVERYGGLPPYQETREYVNRVIGTYRKSK